MAVPIAHLTYDQPALITISPDATLQEAVALMIDHDFSQLPIVEDGKPYGTPASFVTSTSIARALRYFGRPIVHQSALGLVPCGNASTGIYETASSALKRLTPE